MTAVAGIVSDGKIWMGADSAGVAGSQLQIRSDPKVFKVGEFLVGFTSSFRMGQILRFFLSPQIPYEGQEDFDYMVQSFVPAVRSCLKDHGYLKTNAGREEIGTFLIGRRGKLFMIADDMQVAQLAFPFHAIGCGNDLALGSLYSTQDMKEMEPEKRLRLALAAAEQFSSSVRGPFVIEQIP